MTQSATSLTSSDSAIDKAALTRVLGTINPAGGPDLFGLAVYATPGTSPGIMRSRLEDYHANDLAEVFPQLKITERRKNL